MQISIRFVKSAVKPALFDVERLHQFPVLAALLAFPNLPETMLVDVPDAKAPVQQMRGASEDIAVTHRVDPECRRGAALVIVMLTAYLLLNRV